MNCNLTEDAIQIIVLAYKEGLHIEWHQKGDWLLYSVRPSIFSILHKKSCTEYEKVVSYNIKDIEVDKNDSRILRIVTQDNISFLFKVPEE